MSDEHYNWMLVNELAYRKCAEQSMFTSLADSALAYYFAGRSVARRRGLL